MGMSNLDGYHPNKNESYQLGYQQGRADAERDFQNSDYWNDYLAKVIADAKAEEREKVLNEIKEIIATKTNALYWIEQMINTSK